MATTIQTPELPAIDYPDSDGLPIADNTLQFQWIGTIMWGVNALFLDEPNVFVAGDLLWYPVERQPKIRIAPDVFIAFGRPKGYRGSYKQWEEGNVAPQVAFEVLSPGNSAPEMDAKFLFYEKYGVEEYYVYDPDDGSLEGWLRRGDRLEKIAQMMGFVSPLLSIRFEPGEGPDNLKIFRPDGVLFRTASEWIRKSDHEQRLAEEERLRAEAERRRGDEQARLAEEERLRAEAERRRGDEQARLAEEERLRARSSAVAATSKRDSPRRNASAPRPSAVAATSKRDSPRRNASAPRPSAVAATSKRDSPKRNASAPRPSAAAATSKRDSPRRNASAPSVWPLGCVNWASNRNEDTGAEVGGHLAV